MATTPDTRSTSAPGESRNGHFAEAASVAAPRFSDGEMAPGWGKFDDGAWDGPSLHDRIMNPRRKPHNGMNEHPDIPRFGADDYDG